MLTLSGLRDRYGSNYVTVISEDIVVPWSPLSIGDFITYDERIRRGDISLAVLEDEIFTKCVIDNDAKWMINTLPAGTVTTVVQNIMETSGPMGIEQFNTLLDQKRVEAASPLHQMVSLVCRAFPGYKPEDVYTMKYDIFILRLAQAEDTLLRMHLIEKPIRLLDPEVEEEKPKFNKVTPPELRALWEKQNTQRTEPVPQPPPPEKKQKTKPPAKSVNKAPPGTITTGDQSPIFYYSPKADQPIVHKGLANDRVATENAVGSPPIDMMGGDDNALRAKMIADAQQIYAGVIKKMESKKAPK